MLRIASASCALCAVSVLLVAPFEVAAKSGGAAGGVRSFHGAAHIRAAPFRATRFRATHPRAFRRPLLGGAVLPVGYYDPYYGYAPGDGDNVQPGGFDSPPPAPPRVLNCRRSQETVTVPSQIYGTREIKITRC